MIGTSAPTVVQGWLSLSTMGSATSATIPIPTITRGFKSQKPAVHARDFGLIYSAGVGSKSPIFTLGATTAGATG